jgi:hypothetical protein
MKAQVFLELVGEMREAQNKYYGHRTYPNLIAAKELEKRVDAVVKAGRLEPDVPAAEVFTAVEFQEQLDFLADQRPNDVEGE